jgi:SAM-dependent methyltransferase
VSAATVVPPPAGAGEIEADLADAAHRHAVDHRLRAAIEAGARSFSAALAATEGADPRLVAQRLRALGHPACGEEPEPFEAPAPWDPELHARDFEWYFTPTCAAELAARVGTPGSSVLCLGTPTVAFALLAVGRVRRVTLVDRNPLAFHRHRAPGTLDARLEDLAAARLDAGAYDAAVLDAPWYPAALEHWLAVAARAVRPGGRVALALLPALHRPSARADRAAILTRARALGAVSVAPGWLRYATPRFEHEALAAAGVGVPAQWRRADLLEIVVRAPLAADREPPAPAPPSAPAWTRFVIGPQVIQLDPCAPVEDGDLLSPIDGDPGFRYGSISTRDPQRASIGLWTSRSRVARVRRPAEVAALLERLAATGELRSLADAPALRSLAAGARARLLDALAAIVGPPTPAPAQSLQVRARAGFASPRRSV